jgi:hypothetical protein
MEPEGAVREEWRRTELGYAQGAATILLVQALRPSRGRRRSDRGKLVAEIRWVAVVDGKILSCARLREAKAAVEAARLESWLVASLGRAA